MGSTVNSEIPALVSELCETMGLDLVHLAVKRVNQETQIEVLTDLPGGGVTIDACSRLNKRLCEELDERGIFTDGYSVRVSSPGVDRPLRSEKDFRRVIGRAVRCYLSQKLAGKMEHVGIVEEASADGVVITGNPEPLKIPFDIINKAIQEI